MKTQSLITLFLRKSEFCQRSSWKGDFLKTDQTVLLHQSLLLFCLPPTFQNQPFRSIYPGATLKSKVCFSGNLTLKCNSMKNHYWFSSGVKNKERNACTHWRNLSSSSPLLIEDFGTSLQAHKHYMLQTSWLLPIQALMHYCCFSFQ